MLNFKGNWDRHLTIVEFICNNSYQATTSMALYDIYLGIQVIDSNLLEQRKKNLLLQWVIFTLGWKA